MLTLPNFLTLLRIIAVPVFLILITSRAYGAAFVLFLAAGITDTVDGVLARLTNASSDLGASLDPLADKLLLVSSFVLLAWLGVIPLWLMIIALTRDVVILTGYLVLYFFARPMAVDPTAISKFNTFMEMGTIGFALAALARPDMPMAMVNTVIWTITGSTITISGVHYVYKGLLWLQRAGAGPQAPRP